MFVESIKSTAIKFDHVVSWLTFEQSFKKKRKKTEQQQTQTKQLWISSALAVFELD